MLYDSGFQTLSRVAEFHDFLMSLLKTIGEVTRVGSAARPTSLEGTGGKPSPIQRLHERLSQVQTQLENWVGSTATLIESGAETLQMAGLLSDIAQPGDLRQWKVLRSQAENLLKRAIHGAAEQEAFVGALGAVDGFVQKEDVAQSLDALGIIIEQLHSWSNDSLGRRMRSAPAMRSLLRMQRILSTWGRLSH